MIFKPVHSYKFKLQLSIMWHTICFGIVVNFDINYFMFAVII